MADGYLGPYRLDELLGSGGSAQVWRAHDTLAGRTVTLKVLAPVLTGDLEYRRRFEREARIASLLNGPHIVSVHTFGELEGRLFIESEFIDGLDIEALLEWEGPLAPEAAVALIAQVAAALDQAHAVGLVHRDVKPQNIIVEPDNTAYLIDFGTALQDGQSSITQSGMLIGTPAYMAPEQYAGAATARSDIYALGCVLFECLTGHRPFRSGNPAQLMRAHMDAPRPSAAALAPAIPAALDAVIARAMARDQDRRFSSAGEFAAAARAALTDAGTAASGFAEVTAADASESVETKTATTQVIPDKKGSPATIVLAAVQRSGSPRRLAAVAALALLLGGAGWSGWRADGQSAPRNAPAVEPERSAHGQDSGDTPVRGEPTTNDTGNTVAPTLQEAAPVYQPVTAPTESTAPTALISIPGLTVPAAIPGMPDDFPGIPGFSIPGGDRGGDRRGDHRDHDDRGWPGRPRG